MIRIDDPLVASVNGVWKLSGNGARLTVERSDEEPEATVGIELLPTLAFAHDTAVRNFVCPAVANHR